MRRMYRVFLVIMAVVVCAGCGSTPAGDVAEALPELPTYTPYPTYTALPTSTPYPTAVPPTSTPAPTDTPTTEPSPTATATPTETEPPTPPPPTEVPTLAPTAVPPTAVPQVVPWKQDFQDGIWTWNLYDVKKRKAVYYYSKSTVAQGYYLLVFIQLTNTSSGSAYPCHTLSDVCLIDGAGNRHEVSSPLTVERDASLYAGWQYQTDDLWSKYSPGQVVGAVEAWDLPEGSGDIYLHIGDHTIFIGNFDELPVEE